MAACKPPRQGAGYKESQQHPDCHHATRSGLDGLLGHGGDLPPREGVDSGSGDIRVVELALDLR